MNLSYRDFFRKFHTVWVSNRMIYHLRKWRLISEKKADRLLRSPHKSSWWWWAVLRALLRSCVGTILFYVVFYIWTNRFNGGFFQTFLFLNILSGALTEEFLKINLNDEVQVLIEYFPIPLRQFVFYNGINYYLRKATAHITVLALLSMIRYQRVSWISVFLLVGSLLSVRLVDGALRLFQFSGKHEKSNVQWLFIVIFLVCAYGPLDVNIPIAPWQKPNGILMSIFCVSLIAAGFAWRYLFSWKDEAALRRYCIREITKQKEDQGTVLINETLHKEKIKEIREVYEQTQEHPFPHREKSWDWTGLQDLYVQRVMYRGQRRLRIFSLICTGLACLFLIFNALFKILPWTHIQKITGYDLLIVYIFYLFNPWDGDIRKFFSNVDLPFFSYGFYHEPKNVLRFFHLRWKYLVMKRNPMVSVFLILGGVANILAGTWGDMFYFLLLVGLSAILIPMIYLAVYYIFQPYNAAMEETKHFSTGKMIFIVLLYQLMIRNIFIPRGILPAGLLLLSGMMYYGVRKKAPEKFHLKE